MSKWGRGIRGVLLKKQTFSCCYCEDPLVLPKKNQPVTRKTATLEHLKRREEGGTTTKDNCAISCAECNTGRGRQDWFTYKTYVQEVIVPLRQVNANL